MSVYTVVANIQGSIFVPPDVQVIFCERDVLDLGERLDPVDTTCLFRPKCFIVIDRMCIKIGITLRID